MRTNSTSNTTIFNKLLLNSSLHVRMWLLTGILASCLVSCKKWVTVDPPPTSTSEDNVFNSNSTAIAVLTGIYTNMATGGIEEENLRTMLTGLLADELVLDPGSTDQRLQAYYTNNMNTQNTAGTEFWFRLYKIIYITNSAIEQLALTTKLDPPVQKQLMGEALFMRAFCYYYLVNYYGDVPLVLTSNYQKTKNLARTAKATVLSKLVEDLKQAKSLLSPNFLDGSLMSTTTERLRPTKWTASALLSRVYLDAGNYDLAEAESTEIINNTAQFSLVPLNDVFLKNSNETIWSLMPLNATYGATVDGSLFVLPSTGPEPWGRKYFLSPFLINSFESGDKRKAEWVNSASSYFYAYKYKLGPVVAPTTEYMMVFRMGEQYLNRAEARARQNNLLGAADDINVIRSRADLSDVVPTTKDALLDTILHERQVELFTEGFRWIDLKRFGKTDEVMSIVTPQKGGQWKSYEQYFPIPLTEVMTDPQLKQNEGY